MEMQVTRFCVVVPIEIAQFFFSRYFAKNGSVVGENEELLMGSCLELTNG